MQLLKQSSTAKALVFFIYQSSDHVTGLTGASPTVTLSKNGASFASPSGAVSEIGSGFYKVAGNATDTNTLGALALSATASGGDQATMAFCVVAFDPDVATNLGLSALPTASPNANGGLPILSSSGTTLAYTISTLTTYTGNTVQTGDAYARIGAAGAGLTALGDTRIANLDTAVSSRGTSTLTQSQVTGGAYTIQSSSCVLGDARIANLDAAVSTRGTSTLTQSQVTGGAYAISSASCVLGDARIANLDAAVTTRMATYTQPTGFLAATFPTGTLANRTNITNGTLDSVSSVLGDVGGGVVGDLGGRVHGSVASVTGSVGSISGIAFPTNFSALAITSGGAVTSTLDPTALRSAMGLASANLDTQLAALVKIQAATYDSATVSGSVITLSNGHTINVTSSGRALT